MFLKLNENVKNAILVDHHVIGQIGLFMEHTEDEKKTTAREIRKAWKRTDKERRGGGTKWNLYLLMQEWKYLRL